MKILLAVLFFIIPVLLRKYFKMVQITMGLIWIILWIFLSSLYNFSNENIQLVALLLPMWVFGSLYALDYKNTEISVIINKFIRKFRA
jgi:hypothetical protein